MQTRTITYGYDGLNRLTSAAEAGATTNSYGYQYDKAGNRLDPSTGSGQHGGRSYDAANQVIGWSYDAAGNLLSDGTTAYTYDALNRAVTTGGPSTGSGQHTTNQYNADGVLVQQGTTRYTQDLASPLSQILGDGTSTYIYGAERLYAQAGGTQLWYATDALGSVRQTLNASGAVLGNVAYDPWGAPQSGSVPTFGFTGELQQGSNVYLRARWYNATNGSFTARDPFVGMPEQPYSLMPYQYAYSAPTTWTDASGRAVEDSSAWKPCPPGFHRVALIFCLPNGPGDVNDPGVDEAFAPPVGIPAVPPFNVPAAPSAPAPAVPVEPAPVPVAPGIGPGVWKCLGILGWVFVLSGDSAQDLPAPQPQPQPSQPQPSQPPPTLPIPSATPDPCDSIHVPPGVTVAQVVGGTDKKAGQDAVTKARVVLYARAMCKGASFPPIEIVHGVDYDTILDGHTRFVASRLARKPIGEVVTIDISQRGANWSRSREWTMVTWG